MTIDTIYGKLDADALTKEEHLENGILVVEYYLERSHNEGGRVLVHRSTTVQLAGVSATGVAKI